jgi:hypothetical protein
LPSVCRTGHCLEIDEICDSRKSVSKFVYPVTGPNPPMYEVGAGLL